MSLNLTGLTAYTKQLVKPLLTSAVFDAKTQQMIKDYGIVIPGAKSAVQIPLMDTDANFQTDACGWSASGSTTFTQSTITVGKIKIEEAICVKDLEAYFTQEALKAGSTYTEFQNADFQAAYLEKKNKRIAAQLESAIWQGDTTGSGGMNLNKFDGFTKLVSSAAVNANVSGYNGTTGAITTVTASNVVAATEGIYKAIPVAVLAKGDVKIFVGNDWYRLLIMAYRALNLFAYNPQDVNASSFVLPGTNVEIVSTNGLNGTGDAYAASLSNMAIAVDLVDEDQAYTMFYSQDFNEIRFRTSFKLGVGTGFASEWVKFVAAI
jgi:hypothetical protein